MLYDGGVSNAPPNVSRVRERPSLPESFGEWIERAESDYMSMLRVLASPPITDSATFHGHQCAEEYLKAALILRDIQPPRTHVLKELLALGDPRLRQQHRDGDPVLQIALPGRGDRRV